MKSLPYICVLLLLCSFLPYQLLSQRQMEKLDRGIVAVRTGEHTAFVSWRLLGTESPDIGFDIYKQPGKGRIVQLNKSPLKGPTHFIDSLVDFKYNNTYIVKPVLPKNQLATAVAGQYVLPAGTPIRQYLSIPLQQPAGGVSADGQSYSYSANDASAADLDGDGIYEIILKWEPSNAKNPPQTGFTGNQLIDAYKLDGTHLWRIDLGRNIRSGAAYTQFLVYDFDGDGKAELVCKTADGTIDGSGKVIGDSTKDWRTYTKGATYGKIVDGPEYLTVFDGITGAAMVTSDFIPNRYPLDGWGGIGGNGRNDNSGGRSDRFTAGVAYLDGIHPSIVYVRGWYGRSVVAAWDWRNGALTSRWVFDTKDGKNPYSGMANHSVTVGDVDHDGKDEICVGAMTVDDNGQGLYTTGLRHGDALHLSVMHPDSTALQVYGIHENEDSATDATGRPGVALFNAANGQILWRLFPGEDVGRGVAADIDPRHPGFENWGGPGGLRDFYGKEISPVAPSSTNFVVWWDGDLTRELLDKNRIDKWDWTQNKTINLFTAEGCVSNNGTKATPALSADLFGDWREEVIWRTADNKELRIYTTTIPTSHRLTTLMHDPQYRVAIAWQNVGYNQPPHPGFYLGAGMRSTPSGQEIGLASSRGSENRLSKDANEKGKLLYASHFSDPSSLQQWHTEMEALPASKVAIQNGQLVLDTKGGVTVWLAKKLKGNLRIEYSRKVVLGDGVNDRVSDLNQFWMASDPRQTNLFTRSGAFSSYDSLQLYYVGMGGNTNSTTRFRKYVGDGSKPLVAEYTDSAHLLVPNKEYQVTIIVKNGTTSYWVNGERYFHYTDPAPLKEGYFGFRSTFSRQEISDIKIYQLP
ncbi:rhamnogalacturonan lyase family protein [Filimonas effusa]|uniref:rhamnogalacturonan lyase family protein n=1 Tax=Filimonas effusa TaxID=2508721 RepID=UPI0013E93909|nr:DUF6250 domain-containing protein [Filimonas effusa]